MGNIARRALVALLLMGVAGLALPALGQAALGSLTMHQIFAGAEHLDVKVAPGDQHVYALLHDEPLVVAYSRNPPNGDLGTIQYAPAPTVSVSDGQLSEMAIAPDGANLYVSSGIGGAEFAEYTRNPVTGVLALSRTITNGGPITDLNGAGAIAVAPGGDEVYVASHQEDAIIAFFRDLDMNGLLSYSETETGNGLQEPDDMVVSPNGGFVYVSSDETGKIKIYGRGGLTPLTYLGEIGAGTDTQLLFEPGMSISSNSQDLYTSAFRPSNASWGIAHIKVDPTTGELSKPEFYRDGVDGDGIEHVVETALSADNQSLYTVADREDSLAVFQRDPETGVLAFIERHRDSDGATDGLWNVDQIAVSGDSKNVYVTTPFDDIEGTIANWLRQTGPDPPTQTPAAPMQTQQLDADLSSLRTGTLKHLSAVVECNHPCVAQLSAEGNAGSVGLKSVADSVQLAAGQRVRVDLDFKKKKLKKAGGKTAKLDISLTASGEGGPASDDAEVEIE